MFSNFRNKKRKINIEIFEIIENIDLLNEDDLPNIYCQIISKGEEQIYDELFEKRPLSCKLFLEYAIVYGRFNILEKMLKQDCYESILSVQYNPYLLENCDPNVTADIYNNSWWSNDEHERYVVNSNSINHSKCFEIMKTYPCNKKSIDLISAKKWFELSCGQVKYYGGTYYPTFDVILSELLTEVTILNAVNLLENIIEPKLLLKIITTSFKAEDIIQQLKIC